MVSVTVLMPCYNRSYDLVRTLQAYDRQTTCEPFEIIAIDDGSSDATFEVLSKYQPTHYQLLAIRQSTNQGPGAARNVGIERASAPIVVFVGDDIIPCDDFVDLHLKAHRRHPDPRIAILGRVTWADDIPQNTLMKHIDGLGAQQFSYYYLQHGTEYDYRHFYTANVSIKRKMFEMVSEWFDKDFVYAAFEDPELAYRLSKHGLQILYDSNICGKHYHYHSIWSFATRQQWCGRSAWTFIKKHPQVRKDILPEFYWHLGLALANMTKRSISRSPNRWEVQAVRLACHFEWQSNSLIDDLYLEILKYFYYKGALESFWTKSNLCERLLIAYARGKLLPVLRKFVHRAQAAGIVLPEGFTVEDD
jgi:glycosyltransferase involved in cell wall biosynthesis